MHLWQYKKKSTYTYKPEKSRLTRFCRSDNPFQSWVQNPKKHPKCDFKYFRIIKNGLKNAWIRCEKWKFITANGTLFNNRTGEWVLNFAWTSDLHLYLSELSGTSLKSTSKCFRGTKRHIWHIISQLYAPRPSSTRKCCLYTFRSK